MADTNSNLEWQTHPRNVWLIKNECHLQIKIILNTNKAKYNKLITLPVQRAPPVGEGTMASAEYNGTLPEMPNGLLVDWWSNNNNIFKISCRNSKSLYNL